MIHFLLWLLGIAGIAYFIWSKAFTAYQKSENNKVVKIPAKLTALTISIVLILVALWFVDIQALRLVEVTRQREELKKQEAINKDIAILKAEGEAKALQIKGNSISSNPKIIQLQWIDKWDGTLPHTMLSNGGSYILDMKDLNSK